MKNKFNNIEIIITIVKQNKSLFKVLRSLSRQTFLPKKIIIVTFEKLKTFKYKNKY